jgi:hypothetical protein
MYIPIAPELIVAYFEQPVKISRLIRFLQYKNLMRRRLKQFAHHTTGQGLKFT